MSAEKGWIGDPQPPKEWHDPHFHSPCPVCGQPTRYKQFGPIRCACDRYWTKEAMEAQRAWQEEGVWQAKQRCEGARHGK